MSAMLDHPVLRSAAAAPRISSILVWAGLGAQANALTRLGVGLANTFGARLIGVSFPPRPHSRWDTAIEEDSERRLVEAAGEEFRAAASAVRAGMIWRSSEGPMAQAATKLGWAADLLITNLEGCGEEEGRGAAFHMAKRTQAAVLARPHACSALRPAKAIVMWSGSTACRRAVAASLPFLARAQSVVVLCDPASIPMDENDPSPLIEGLQLRGIDARLARSSRTSSVDALEEACRRSSDLIVSEASVLHSPWLWPTRRDRLLQEMKSLLLISC